MGPYSDRVQLSIGDPDDLMKDAPELRLFVSLALLAVYRYLAWCFRLFLKRLCQTLSVRDIKFLCCFTESALRQVAIHQVVGGQSICKRSWAWSR